MFLSFLHSTNPPDQTMSDGDLCHTHGLRCIPQRKLAHTESYRAKMNLVQCMHRHDRLTLFFFIEGQNDFITSNSQTDATLLVRGTRGGKKPGTGFSVKNHER